MKILIFLYCTIVMTYASISDYRTGIIPDRCHILLLLLLLMQEHYFIRESILVFGIFLIPVLSQHMGMGDLKYIVTWTLLQGNDIYYCLWIASGVALIYACIKKVRNRSFPFAPFLSIGYLVILFCRYFII